MLWMGILFYWYPVIAFAITVIGDQIVRQTLFVAYRGWQWLVVGNCSLLVDMCVLSSSSSFLAGWLFLWGFVSLDCFAKICLICHVSQRCACDKLTQLML
eukprot:TRINITY_DN10497_c0_g2_i1.p6 TRINITY_DN10497_c0_g2~~TRINITY_DN10497_c0_g2_i1.p6  ORF type:complete len:100 (-),score=1.31 TRINITY_DN10497_c0_g2_i1:75-374(-)